MIPLIGYTDRLSGRPGDTIEFKVSSCYQTHYDAALVRIICADPNPAGPGMLEAPVDSDLNGAYPSRLQSFHPGSYGSAAVAGLFHAVGSFSLVATIWPTTPDSGKQGILSCRDAGDSDGNGNGVDLYVNDDGGCGVSMIASGKDYAVVHTGKKLKARNWYRVWASFDQPSGRLSVGQQALHGKRELTLQQRQSATDTDAHAGQPRHHRRFQRHRQ